MKAIYTFLTIALLAALAALGLTALASADDDNPPVFGFTNNSCSSLDYMWFPNYAALIAYDGTEESDGFIWNFGSYLEQVENYECKEVVYGEVKVKGKAPKQKQNPGTGSGSGGGGGTTPTTPETSPPPEPAPTIEFNDQDLEDLINDWLGCTNKIESIKGYLEFEITAYTWTTVKDAPEGYEYVWGETKHKDGGTVDIFTQSIAQNEWKIDFSNMMMQTILNEYVHTIQGPPNIYEDSMFDREVEAYNLSYHWYKALFKKRPPFKPWTATQIAKAKRDSNYVAADLEIKRLRKKHKNEGDLNSADEITLEAKMAELGSYVPDPSYDNKYDRGALSCKEEEK